MMRPEQTVSTAATAELLFLDPNYSRNRRKIRSADPERAVSFQFERVVDVVASEAIVLCDERGSSLMDRGDKQLCRMLARSVPSIVRGDRDDLQRRLKSMDVLRPGVDGSLLAVGDIAVPNKKRRLYVASISESEFNTAGVHHAKLGVKRILGIPESSRMGLTPRISSRDRLVYDVSRALYLGYYDFHASPLAAELRQTRTLFCVAPRSYATALEFMMERVDRRLVREGLVVDHPTRMDRWFGRGYQKGDGYRERRFQLPVRCLQSGQQRGVLALTMQCYSRRFEIPRPPNAVLYLE
jgi:hypothetical protein